MMVVAVVAAKTRGAVGDDRGWRAGGKSKHKTAIRPMRIKADLPLRPSQ